MALKRIARCVAAGLLAAGGLFGPLAHAAKRNTINFGWTAWSDAEFVTRLAKDLIQTHYGYHVKLTLADIGIQYEGVAKGSLDGMLMAWLPDTHRDYWKKVGTRVWDLGPLYTGAKLGWVVPDYIPKSQLDSIADLNKASVRANLDGRIQGIDPGAGLMQLSGKAVKAYGLSHYKLVSASGAAMTAVLARAEKQHKWVVVTGWTPHWMFGRWKLRFLKDPKGVLGGPQHIDAVVREGFTQDYPQVADFLARMYIPLDQLQDAMYRAQKTSYKQAISEYEHDHACRIHYWYTGNVNCPGAD